MSHLQKLNWCVTVYTWNITITLHDCHIKIISKHDKCNVLTYMSYTSNRVKERVRTGPTSGPYKACMKFSDFQQIMLDGFPHISAYEAKNVLQEAFPGVVSDRSTYILGIRPSHMQSLGLATPESLLPSSSSASALSSTPGSSHATKSLTAENLQLQMRVSELEAEVQSLRESSVQFTAIEQQADRLITHSSISHGPDTLEHLESFSITSIIDTVKRDAPDLYRLFERVGNPHRNAQSEEVTVEEVKGLHGQ